MARPRRSRSLREELAEAEAEINADVQDIDGNMVQEDDDAQDVASVQSAHTPIRPH